MVHILEGNVIYPLKKFGVVITICTTNAVAERDGGLVHRSKSLSIVFSGSAAPPFLRHSLANEHHRDNRHYADDGRDQSVVETKARSADNVRLDVYGRGGGGRCCARYGAGRRCG